MTYLSRNMLKVLPLAVVAVLAFAAAGPAAAKSTPACWKTLINDWYDGRIDGTYPIHCYRDALKHLPTDVETYSSARDDIRQALQERITQGRKGSTGATGSTGNNGTGGTGGTGGTQGGNGGSSGDGGNASGPIGQAFEGTKPGNADSVPIPLIVLGAVALLLMTAGGVGFLARRNRTRKLELASAATLPGRPGSQPPKKP